VRERESAEGAGLLCRRLAPRCYFRQCRDDEIVYNIFTPLRASRWLLTGVPLHVKRSMLSYICMYRGYHWWYWLHAPKAAGDLIA
jgi:hypothetical protein